MTVPTAVRSVADLVISRNARRTELSSFCLAWDSFAEIRKSGPKKSSDGLMGSQIALLPVPRSQRFAEQLNCSIIFPTNSGRAKSPDGPLHLPYSSGL